MPSRSFWIEAKESLEQNSKTTHVSSKILGIGILCVAFLFLAIGLIIGLKFPEFVEERIKDDECIVSTETTNYQQWIFDEQFVRYEHLYYWTITNHEAVLETGVDPKFQRRGPYIYQKTARKTSVSFRDGFMFFKYLISYEYDVMQTQLECGVSCKEDDQIVVINPDQIEEMVLFKSVTNYFLGNLPRWINLKIEDLSARQTNVTENIFSLLGLLNNTLVSYTYDAILGHLMQNISFGRWIGMNDTEDKSWLINFRNSTNFSSLEMKKMFDTLSTATLMDLPSNSEITDSCFTFVSTHTCSLQYLLLNDSTLNSGLTDSNAFGINYTNYRQICGLILLLMYINESNANCFLNSSEWVREMFCFQNDSDCRTFQSNYTYLSHYLFILKSFIFEYLFEQVKTWSVTSVRTNAFRILGVKNLTIGYNSDTGYVYGTLTKNLTKENDDIFTVVVKYSTCFLNRDSANNMVLYDLNGIAWSTVVQPNMLYTYYMPPLVSFKACTSYLPSLDNFQHFVEEFSCSMPFIQPSQTEFSGVIVYNFTPDFSNIYADHKLNCGNRRSKYYYPSFSGSFVEIEPLSGKIWRKNIFEEQRVDLSDEESHIDTILGFNISNISFSVYLRQSSVVISDQDVEKHKSRIKQMMDASCAGMISLTVIFSIVFLIAITILFWPKAKTKVHPFILEQSVHLANSRV